jgi:hypothetical protein
MFNAIKKYLANPNSKGASGKNSKKSSFFDLAKQHIAKTKGPKENLGLNVDKILYGK